MLIKGLGDAAVCVFVFVCLIHHFFHSKLPYIGTFKRYNGRRTKLSPKRLYRMGPLHVILIEIVGRITNVDIFYSMYMLLGDEIIIL